MRIAVEGCAHGELEKIYESIGFIEEKEGYKVDLLICCGDFQATRNINDLECMAIPRKFFDICSFYKYYSGEKEAPMLTIFIGGNHEASNYMQELPYGGWVAPNIYYLGYAGVINVNGLRIGGMSGIFKGHDYLKGRHEYSPFTENTKRSVYHTRQIDVFRLKQLTGRVDIFISHDWPRGIYNYGNSKQLLRFKPAFRDEIERDQLGSPPCQELLHHMKPSYWFAGHLHCKFSAVVHHKDADSMTKFLALDKCLPKRRFLQIIEVGKPVPEKSPLQLEYDLEWLTILFLTNHLISVKNFNQYMPGEGNDERYNFTPTDDEKASVFKKFEQNLGIPKNFIKTAEPYNPQFSDMRHSIQPRAVINPQTNDFCERLQIDDPLSLAVLMAGEELNHSSMSSEVTENTVIDESGEELDISDCVSDDSTLECTKFEDTPVKIIVPPLASTLPKPKFDSSPDLPTGDLKDDDISTASVTASDNESVIENFDNKWIEDRTPNQFSQLQVKKNDEQVDTLITPVKKFKRRNESIYNTPDVNE